MSYRKRNAASDTNPYAELYWSEPKEGEVVTVANFSVFIPNDERPPYDEPRAYARAANPSPRLDARVATRSFASRPSMRYTKARKSRR